MPNFPKPAFPYTYDPATEIQRLRQHRASRQVPLRSADTLLIGTWNIANFGGQQRRDQDKQLIAEIASWFDLLAVQEVKENYGDLVDVAHLLGGSHKILMSDPAGNDERLAFLYDPQKLRLLEQIGEIGVPPSEFKHIKLPGITRKFDGFDRNPYLGSWQFKNFTFLLASVHLFYGSEKKADIDRRALETFAVARWADLQKKSPFSFTRNVIALGDFNMPKKVPTDAIFKSLTSKGLEIPPHTSKVGSSTASDAEYDQIAFFPGDTKNCFTGSIGVFDYDKVVFPDLWQQSQAKFRSYLKYYFSDHRPMWVEFRP